MELVATFNLSKENFENLLESVNIKIDEFLEQLFVNQIDEDGMRDVLSLGPVFGTGDDRFVCVGKLAMHQAQNPICRVI